MKFVACFFVFALTFAVLSSTQAASKRAVAYGRCPKNSTPEECKEYAEKMSKTMNYCHTYNVYENSVYWMSCGVVSCGDLTVVEEDLSKPYPDCCKSCKLNE